VVGAGEKGLGILMVGLGVVSVRRRLAMKRCSALEVSSPPPPSSVVRRTVGSVGDNAYTRGRE
jgi:hypothetical protein